MLVGFDWPEPMMFLLLHLTCSCIFMHTYFTFSIFIYIELFWDFSDCLFLPPPPLSLVYVSCVTAPKRKSAPSRNPLRSGASTSSNPTPSSIRFRDELAKTDFFENFFRLGVHSERQVILSNFSNTDLPIVIHSKGWESLCDVPVTCPSVLIQEFYSNMHEFDYSVPLFVTCGRGMRIVVISDIVSEVIRVSKVEHPNYFGCDYLRTVSKDKLISSFCERPSDWGDRQFTSCMAFAKDPRFLNMVMTSVLHPLSHYNSITEPCARFLLSLLEHLIIDFPSYFILFILIFPSAITRILRHFFVPFPVSDHFHVMCTIDVATIKRSKAQLRSRWSGLAAPSTPSGPSTSTPSSSMGGVTLDAIMA